MFRKFIMILIFLTAVFLTASCASAVDDNATDVGIDPSGDGEATFNDLNSLIKESTDDEIRLEKDYAYSNSTDSDFKNGIRIERSLTLNGQGHSIDAKSSARIFKITAENVTLKNIHLINGYNRDDGGAVITSKSIVIINSTFENSIADYGGAISTVHGNIHIENSSFTGNGASDFNGDEWAFGGGIYTSYGSVNVINSEFTQNTGLYGGAIHARNGNVTVSSSTFTDNACDDWGAAIFTSGDLMISDCIFSGNVAQGEGIIYATGGNIHISDSDFTGNVQGLGLYQANVTIAKCNFISNHGTSVIGVDGAIIEDCIFTANHAEEGIVQNWGDLKIVKCDFNQNAGDNTIIQSRAGLNVENCNFNSNTGGNSIVQSYSALNVENCDFTKNSAEYTGSIRGLRDVTVSNSNFVENTGLKTVGAIYARNIRLVNSVLKNNRGFYDNAIFGKANFIGSKIIENNKDVTNRYSSGVRLVKVNPTPLIKASKTKTMKTKTKIKKYAVTLKSQGKVLKKVRVYLTVKGKKYKKTFTAKTNSRGLATFKIKKLTKMGTYTATMKFKGNKNYRPAVMKLKITVKKKKCTFKVKSKSAASSGGYKKVAIDEGHPVDASLAYAALNRFRAEKNVWVWNDDDQTKTYYNTDASNTLKPLERDSDLDELAKIRAKELSIKFSHDCLDDSDWYAGLPYVCGENIAAGNIDALGATELWKESYSDFSGQGHRRNMLDSEFNCVGIAGFEIDGFFFWVQCFAKK